MSQCLTCNDTGTYKGAIGIKRTGNTAEFNLGQDVECLFCKPQPKAVDKNRGKSKKPLSRPQPSKKQEQMELL